MENTSEPASTIVEENVYDETSEQAPTIVQDHNEYDETSTTDSDSSDSDDDNDNFDKCYLCFPFSHLNRSQLEDGNRIIMPPSAIEHLMSMEIEYPMLFEIINPSSGRLSHCGVLEFSAEEGSLFMPNWMMKNMQLKEGETVNIKNVSLLKGTYMKIQPHTMKFTAISNLKDVLERTLRDFSCVTAGDTIMINHNEQQYYIDIVEASPFSAVSLFETDCEVDFAPPLDYKEPVIKAKEEKVKEEPKLKPFTGVCRRLDGQPLTSSIVENESSVADEGENMATESKFNSAKRVGKIVFGNDDAKQTLKKTMNVSEADVKEKKFQPFTGKKYTLAG